DKTSVDLPSRQRSALGAHVPQNCSGTAGWRTVSASEALERSAKAKAKIVRMVVALAVGTRNSTSAPRYVPPQGDETRPTRSPSPGRLSFASRSRRGPLLWFETDRRAMLGAAHRHADEKHRTSCAPAHSYKTNTMNSFVIASPS